MLFYLSMYYLLWVSIIFFKSSLYNLVFMFFFFFLYEMVIWFKMEKFKGDEKILSYNGLYFLNNRIIVFYFSYLIMIYFFNDIFFLLGIWNKVNDFIDIFFISLMIFYMIEWVISGLINFCFFEKLDVVVILSYYLLLCFDV